MQSTSSSAPVLGFAGEADRGILALTFSSGALQLVALLVSQSRWMLLVTLLLGGTVAS